MNEKHSGKQWSNLTYFNAWKISTRERLGDLFKITQVGSNTEDQNPDLPDPITGHFLVWHAAFLLPPKTL